MEYLKGKMVYLCGPITAVADDGVGWREEITPGLLSFNLNVEDPTKKTANGLGEVKDDKAFFKQMAKDRKFTELKKAFWPIVRKDLRTVDKSDFLIFGYNPDVPMLGTIHELVIAHQQRKPILMYCDDDKVGSLNPWVLTFIKPGCIFTKWSDMFDYLTKVNNGEFDTSHWTL